MTHYQGSAMAACPELPLPENWPCTLPLTRLRFDYRVVRGGTLPDFLGSAWRGALGRRLRALVCPAPKVACQACLLRSRCSFSTFFKPNLARAAQGAFADQDSPAPFALFSPFAVPRWQKGEQVPLYLTLFGDQGRHLPALVHALEAVDLALPGDRAELCLERVQLQPDLSRACWTLLWELGRWQVPGAVLSRLAVPDAIRQARWLGIELLTPTRIKQHGRVQTGQLDFQAWVMALLRRYTQLRDTWGEAAAPLPAREIKARAGQARIRQGRVQPWRGERYSAAQGRQMPISGVLGSLEFSSAGLEALVPLLWVGQWLQVGKGCSFGQGGYRLFSADAEGGSLPATR